MSKTLADAILKRLQAVCRTRLLLVRALRRLMRRWWSQTGSNRRPHACKARALPTELWPRAARRFRMHSHLDVVGLGRLELPTSRLSSARSNQLSYKPELMTPPGEDCESPRARAGLSGKKEKRRRRRSRMIGLTGHCSEEIR
jgi:hypothetical protein